VIGRTNTGKSTLFNRLTGQRYALVHDSPGTTRDRKESNVRWKDKEFIIVDTGGWANDDFIFSAPVKKQMEHAIDTAALVVFVVDAKNGIHPQDNVLSRFLRAKNKNTILVVNKVDSEKDETKVADFYQLGIDKMIHVSANHGRNIAELLDIILDNLGEAAENPEINYNRINIVLVGKPNVGKSSLVNNLSAQERCIVHDTPGTTREALDITLTTKDGREFVLIDTPGLHRKKRFKDDMDYLSALSASQAVAKADVAVLVMDATQGVGETEAKIAEMILENNKACVLAINKWDLVEEREQAAKRFKTVLEEKLQFLWWVKLILISAKTGQRTEKILSEAQAAYAEYSKVAPNDELVAKIRDAERRKPFSRQGQLLKIKKVAQEGICPPRFSFTVNDTTLVHFSYKRYLENNIRDAFGFFGTPIVLRFHKG
jgi:GTP-binding protein